MFDSFQELGRSAEADLQVRVILTRWQELEARSRKLRAELLLVKKRFGLQPETTAPETVGMSESPSDEFTPDELIEMYATREPEVLDWDKNECVPIGDLVAL